MATNNNRNMQECFCIQELVQCVGDKSCVSTHYIHIIALKKSEVRRMHA